MKSPSAFGHTAKAFYVDRLTIGVINVRSFTECVHKCLNEVSCLTANYLKRLRPEAICVLNGATDKEEYALILGPGQSINGADVKEWKYAKLLN